MANNLDSVCEKKSTRFLQVPLKSTEQIYLIFLIPTLVTCVVYVIHFSADLVVAIQHFKENNPVWGCCTIGFMYAPAIAYFMLTISRPDWWMTDDDKLTKGIFCWFCLQLCQLVCFVFFSLYRYAALIVLSIEAIILTGKERTKTLNIAAAPAAIELYFFLQAWFQAAPQAIFQTHLLFRGTLLHQSHQSVVVKVLSILMSIVILAIQTTSFQRFESQRINGRKLPWAMWLKKYCVQELRDLEERAPLKQFDVKEEEIIHTNNPMENFAEQKESTKIQNEDAGQPGSHISLNRQVSVTPPLPPKNVHITPPPTPLRGITTVTPLPIPDIPAPPRPDSICTVAENSESEKIFTKSVSVTETNKNTSSIQSLKVPQRKYSVKGLEEDDPVGKFLSFLWWSFFILARILAIAIFYEFYPLYLCIVLTIHYAVMLIYLFYYAKYYDIITFLLNLWLGLVYIISIIEYKIRFKYADKWVLPYYIFVLMQNTFLTLTWYLYADWDGFWYTYAFYVIFGSMTMCILSTTIYCALLKPKKSRIYTS
ncbi:PREDICTED: uncharacterized protein LOC108574733 [Habropoda laboriosa]|uniref:uncharacterized protein LOC108574733 n=1 Tax=Habropoda laboriosa TaxID=597456 RepID=UPI00083CBC52|nr:PREDICTED: uncharacterized protein LOC108574733 [Habropoda laboriosa]